MYGVSCHHYYEKWLGVPGLTFCSPVWHISAPIHFGPQFDTHFGPGSTHLGHQFDTYRHPVHFDTFWPPVRRILTPVRSFTHFGPFRHNLAQVGHILSLIWHFLSPWFDTFRPPVRHILFDTFQPPFVTFRAQVRHISASGLAHFEPPPPNPHPTPHAM